MNKALVIISEGPHDVSFIKLVLKFFFNINPQKNVKLSEYPKPFSNIFCTTVKQHFQDDLTLDMSHNFFLPDCSFQYNDYFIMLFNSGGKKKVSKVKQLLAIIEQQIKLHDESFDIKEIKYLFTYDADEKNASSVISSMVQQISPVTSNDISSESSIQEADSEILWKVLLSENLKKSDCSVISDNKAFYVWCDNNYVGTLEDILMPVFNCNNNKLINDATIFIDAAFCSYWKEVINDQSATKSKKKADRQKAIFTCAGQGEKPGKPLTAIITDAVLVKKNIFIKNQKIIHFKNFLNQLFST